jgi:hypothetical protein
MEERFRGDNLHSELWSPEAYLSWGLEIYFYGPEPVGGISFNLDSKTCAYSEEATYQAADLLDATPEVGRPASKLLEEREKGDLEIRCMVSWRTIVEIAALLKT